MALPFPGGSATGLSATGAWICAVAGGYLLTSSRCKSFQLGWGVLDCLRSVPGAPTRLVTAATGQGLGTTRCSVGSDPERVMTETTLAKNVSFDWLKLQSSLPQFYLSPHAYPPERLHRAVPPHQNR